MKLTETENGKLYKIVGYDCTELSKNHLAKIGFSKSNVLKVLSNDINTITVTNYKVTESGFAYVIAKKMEVGKDIAKKLIVEPKTKLKDNFDIEEKAL